MDPPNLGVRGGRRVGVGLGEFMDSAQVEVGDIEFLVDARAQRE